MCRVVRGRVAGGGGVKHWLCTATHRFRPSSNYDQGIESIMLF